MEEKTASELPFRRNIGKGLCNVFHEKLERGCKKAWSLLVQRAKRNSEWRMKHIVDSGKKNYVNLLRCGGAV